jgi:peptide/nickel transport system permease protein
MRAKFANRMMYGFMILFVLTGLFHNFIANEKPLICRQGGKLVFPVLNRTYTASDDCIVLLNAPVRYSHNSIDMKNSGAVSPFGKQQLSPGQQRHLLGTDIHGRDVLAGIVFGTSIALKVGLGSMALALILGIFIGLLPAYYGDRGYRMRISSVILTVIVSAMAIYTITFREIFLLLFSPEKALAALVFLLAIASVIRNFPVLNRKIVIPLDSPASIFTGIFQSLPSAFLVLVLISLFAKASVYNIIIVIALLRWPVIARYIRAEVMKIKQERFVEASKLIGLNDRIIIFRHILPYTLTPVMVALAYGFAGTVLLESTLSFLGIGIPADHVSWGVLLGEARQNFSAWWLAVFPGLAIFAVIMMFNTLGGKYKNRI